MFYGLMSVSNANNNDVEYSHVTSEYDYHMVLRDLNVDQANYLINDQGAVFKNDIVFEIVRAEENINYMTGDKRFDMYLFFLNDKDVNEARFRENYLKDITALSREGEGFLISVTPLLRFEENMTANLVTFIVITAILLAVSVFLLTALYNIRVNQYKFTYGVYMTFGADFKRLFATAFWELFVISCVTLIPAVLISTLVVFLIYLPSGFTFHFSILAFLQVALFNLAVTLISVWMPMRVMSIRQPMSLIITEDNSNLVTSPMHSINLLNKKFPTQYEFYSIWRFRKYSVQLLTTAIVFCALFIMGLYLADIYTTDLEYARPQFTVDISRTGFAYDDEMSAELYALEGVEEVRAMDNNIEAMEIASNLITEKINTLPLKNKLVVYDSELLPLDNCRVTNEVLFHGMTPEQIQILERYEYDGDLNCLYNSENMVIVGDSISNIRMFDFQVGDLILISRKTGQFASVDTNLTGRNLLKEQIENFEFEYIPFTVGAVLHNIPSGSMPVFFNVEDYKSITGKKVETTNLNIYVSQDMTPEQIQVLDGKIRDWGRLYGEVKVSNTHQLSLDNIAVDKHYNELLISIAILILFISPLVWFFTQTLYYFKREREFNILQSLGALTKDIRHMYVQGGLVMAGLSLIVAIVLSYLGSYALFYIWNVLLPYFSGENVRFEFYMPWYAILISIVMSVGCGFFSTYLPFRSYIKSRFTLENGGAGESEE